MIVYFDTSAFVPLLIDENGSETARALWDAASSVVSVRLLYVETAAALSRALAMNRVTRATHDRAIELLESLWSVFDVVELDDQLMRQAALRAFDFGLRGYDAVHFAAAEDVAGPTSVVATGDAALLEAWAAVGLTTARVA